MIIYKSRCYNGGKQHKFSPRYNEKPYRYNIKVKHAFLPEVKDLLCYKEYLFDICEWCGNKAINQ